MQEKLHGGSGVPCFSEYYQVAQLSQIALHHATVEVSLWVGLQAIDLDSLTVANLLWLQHSLHLWDRLKNPFKLHSPHYTILSFLDHPSFFTAYINPEANHWSFPPP